MQPLHLDSTVRTAVVDFDPVAARLFISGISVPEDADQFFRPLNEWVEEFCKTYKGPVTFRLLMTYFNTATVRQLLAMMKKMIDCYGKQLTIEWAYEQDDEEIRDRGQELSHILKFDFVLEEVPA